MWDKPKITGNIGKINHKQLYHFLYIHVVSFRSKTNYLVHEEIWLTNSQLPFSYIINQFRMKRSLMGSHVAFFLVGIC